jgi:hypothetical protein
MKSVTAFLLALAISLPAASQGTAAPSAPAQPSPQAATRIAGTVTALSNEGLTLRDATGKEVKVGFAPDVAVLAARPISKDDIKPGDFVASANLSETEGVGRSIEMRLFEAGSRAGEGNRPMTQPGAAPNQVMTNATVTKVARTAAGLELDVQYPGGSRHLIVPPEVTIVGSYPVDPATLKVGLAVTLTAIPGSDGTLRATRIQISAAPAAR